MNVLFQKNAKKKYRFSTNFQVLDIKNLFPIQTTEIDTNKRRYEVHCFFLCNKFTPEPSSDRSALPERSRSNSLPLGARFDLFVKLFPILVFLVQSLFSAFGTNYSVQCHNSDVGTPATSTSIALRTSSTGAEQQYTNSFRTSFLGLFFSWSPTCVELTGFFARRGVLCDEYDFSIQEQQCVHLLGRKICYGDELTSLPSKVRICFSV